MLDGQLVRQDRLLAAVGLLKPLQHELALVGPAVQVEGDGGHRAGDLLVAGVVLPAGRQAGPYLLVYWLALVDLRDQRREDAVKVGVARPMTSRRTKKLSRYSMARAICSDVAFPWSRSSSR